MTNYERKKRVALEKYLGEQGFPGYAKILHNIPLNVTHHPNTVGFIETKVDPNDPLNLEVQRIVINDGLQKDESALVIRHEILHQVFEHVKREMAYLDKTNQKG